MQRRLNIALALLAMVAATAAPASAQHMLPPRVPIEYLEEARALKSPWPDSPEIVEKGKALYRGKGTCANCHGSEGAGDGPVAAQLNPSPRNFQQHGFWRHRTEGEIFWVIKNGSPGTSMIGFAGQLTDEEIWALIQYERTFAQGHGHGRGMGPAGRMGHRGAREGMSGMGHRGAESGSGSCEGGHCER